MEAVAVRVLIVIATTVAMEAVAALFHRYWMHGPGWSWHASHHEHGKDLRFERNDLYAVVFAVFATALFVLGNGAWWPLYWVAVGMTLYGVLYAVLHDGLTHRRWPLRWSPRSGYVARLVQAHRLHHAVHEKHGAVSYGFLYASQPAQLAAQLRDRRHGRAPAISRRTQGIVGLFLAALIVTAWLAAVGYGLFFHRWSWWDALLVPPLIAFICWLNVGLFIVAHDAMHGSLALGRRHVNRAVGQLCLWLYAGFLLHRFEPAHFEHHRSPGTADDPDFHLQGRRFWPWYFGFMRRYMTWREVAGLVTIFVLMTAVLKAPLANVMAFWALPAMLSSVQLFAFGTWLPHRLDDEPFADRHRARSSSYGALASLLSCFHFGYHLEHHLRPDAPWWRLPAIRRARAGVNDADLQADLRPAAASTAPRAANAPSTDRPVTAGSAPQ
jgi:beta-carotene/zeaxanthin 4-ketolase